MDQDVGSVSSPAVTPPGKILQPAPARTIAEVPERETVEHNLMHVASLPQLSEEARAAETSLELSRGFGASFINETVGHPRNPSMSTLNSR